MSYSTQDNESKKHTSYQFHGNKRMIEHNHTKTYDGDYDEGYRSQEGVVLRNVYMYGKQKGNITQNARDKQTPSKPKTFNPCQFKCTLEAI